MLKKVVSGMSVLAMAGGLLIGSAEFSKAEAINIGKVGKIGGAVVGGVAEMDKAKKQMDYYENDGRNEMFEGIKQEDGVNNDPTLNKILDNIMIKLSAVIGEKEASIKEKPYNYFINPETAFNAYCTLGHNISVNTGVFGIFGNNEDKIATVVAHELMHGQRNHPINGAKNRMGIQFATELLQASTGGGNAKLAGMVSNYAKVAGVTKPNEWQADNDAYGYVVAAGYNPGAPAAVWQQIIDLVGVGPKKGMFDDVLNPSTHPDDKARRDNYSKKLTEHSQGKVVVDAATGEVKVNGKVFMKPAKMGEMSGQERAYLVGGNLARVYYTKEPVSAVYAENGTVKIGSQNIVTPADGDKSADELVKILEAIK